MRHLDITVSCQREGSVTRFCRRVAKLRRPIVQSPILECRAIRVGDGANFSREPLESVLKSYRVVAQAVVRWTSTGVHRHAVCVGRNRVVEIRISRRAAILHAQRHPLLQSLALA